MTTYNISGISHWGHISHWIRRCEYAEYHTRIWCKTGHQEEAYAPQWLVWILPCVRIWRWTNHAGATRIDCTISSFGKYAYYDGRGNLKHESRKGLWCAWLVRVWGLIMYEIHMGIPEMKEFWDMLRIRVKSGQAGKNEQEHICLVSLKII